MYGGCVLYPLYPLLFRTGLFWSSIICLTLGKLYGVSVETFRQFVARWKRSFNKADERKSDVGFLLYGRLNHITFLCRLRFCDGGCCVGGLYSNSNI